MDSFPHLGEYAACTAHGTPLALWGGQGAPASKEDPAGANRRGEEGEERRRMQEREVERSALAALPPGPSGRDHRVIAWRVPRHYATIVVAPFPVQLGVSP